MMCSGHKAVRVHQPHRAEGQLIPGAVRRRLPLLESAASQTSSVACGSDAKCSASARALQARRHHAMSFCQLFHVRSLRETDVFAAISHRTMQATDTIGAGFVGSALTAFQPLPWPAIDSGELHDLVALHNRHVPDLDALCHDQHTPRAHCRRLRLPDRRRRPCRTDRRAVPGAFSPQLPGGGCRFEPGVLDPTLAQLSGLSAGYLRQRPAGQTA